MMLSTIYRFRVRHRPIREFQHAAHNPYRTALILFRNAVENVPPASPYVADVHYQARQQVVSAINQLLGGEA